jgi:chromosome segregation ATPase
LFIILQGEVERLCELSPEKLVEYLEYISGSDQYIDKIQNLEQEYINGGVKLDHVK